MLVHSDAVWMRGGWLWVLLGGGGWAVGGAEWCGDCLSALQSVVLDVVAVSRYHLVNSKLPTNAKAITQHKRQKLLIICECFGG